MSGAYDRTKNYIDAEHAVGSERRYDRLERETDRGAEQDRAGTETSAAANGDKRKAVVRGASEHRLLLLAD
eukprot:346333-Pleurochrysis_carterae.AAC.1